MILKNFLQPKSKSIPFSLGSHGNLAMKISLSVEYDFENCIFKIKFFT